MDAARFGRMDRVFQTYVDQRRIAGAVTFVARDGAIVHLQAYGMQDIEAGRPMRPDTIFRVASMSKAVTTVAVMMLYEEGRFMLLDPVSEYLPEFSDPVVAVPAAGAGPGASYSTEKARRPIRIRDLLSHTAGLTYGDGPAGEAYKQAGMTGWFLSDRDETIGDVVKRLAKLPLQGQPGETWQYGYSTDVLGRLVEVVSGEPLDRFVEERICRPLGMKDTCFFLAPGKADRLASVYGIEDGRLVLKEDAAHSAFVHGPRKCFAGGSGLLSTAEDYGRFLQMLLNGGELGGVRLLSPKTVELMRSNHVGDKYGPTAGFGLGFWISHEPGVYGELGSKGAYGWGSAYYPQYVVDPHERLVALFMTQLLPSGGIRLDERFKALTYQAIVR